MFKPNGWVTLTTDFGLRDSYVGEMKGVMLSIAPELRCIDIAHDLPPQQVNHASRVLASAAPRFPTGTVHLAVIDPGVGTDRAPIALLSGGHLFIAPDNGLLSAVVSRLGGVEACHRIEGHAHLPGHRSATFHGRDVFAPTAAALASGLLSLADVGGAWGPELTAAVEAQPDGADGWVGHVVAVDRFGNAVSNVRGELLTGNGYSVEVDGASLPLSTTYGDVSDGELVALIGSDGWVEVAQRNGSAVKHLELSIGASLRVCSVRKG